VKELFQYFDYREYLADYYQDRKSRHQWFSFRWFSQRAGIKSPVYLKLVIEGERNLTAKSIEQFLKVLDLPEKEARYFRHLVQFNQAKTAQNKQDHYSVLRELGNAVSEKIVDQGLNEFYSVWYHPVLRELICIADSSDSPSLIGKQIFPSLSARQVGAGIRFLEEKGFIKRRPDGRWIQSDPHLTTGSKAEPSAVRQYHQTMLEHAAQSIEAFPVEERYITGVTMGVSKECYQAVAMEYKLFREKVLRLVAADEKPSRVYQMVLGLFPCTVRPSDQEAS